MKVIKYRYQYYVEGQCERKLVKTLIEHHLIIPGKTEVFNPIQNLLRPTHLRTLSQNTTIVLIFDTDKTEVSILCQNLAFLETQSNIKKIITIPQNKNLEQELVNCTDIRNAKELLNCKHLSEFKSAFIEEKHLYEKLQDFHFDIHKLWAESKLDQPFLQLNIQNQSNLIKL